MKVEARESNIYWMISFSMNDMPIIEISPSLLNLLDQCSLHLPNHKNYLERQFKIDNQALSQTYWIWISRDLNLDSAFF